MSGEQQRGKAALGVSDITFVSESQPESNSSKQRKKPRRRKAPIYWGKKPNRKKSEVKRKLDSELDLVTGEYMENGEHVESDTEDIPGNSGGERSADEEETEKVHRFADDEETEKVQDANCDEENDATDHQDDEDDVELMENGVSSVNGDVVLLDSNNLGSELQNDDLNSDSVVQNESENASQLPERTLKNHVLFGKESSLPNGITSDVCSEEKECDVEHIGENSSNSIFIMVEFSFKFSTFYSSQIVHQNMHIKIQI